MLECSVSRIGLAALIGLASWPCAPSAAGNGESVTGTAILADFVPPGGSPPENLVPTGPAVPQPIEPDVIKPTGRPVRPDERDPLAPAQWDEAEDFLKSFHKVYERGDLRDYWEVADAFHVPLIPYPVDNAGNHILSRIEMITDNPNQFPFFYTINLQSAGSIAPRHPRTFFIARLESHTDNRFCLIPTDIANELGVSFTKTKVPFAMGSSEVYRADKLSKDKESTISVIFYGSSASKCAGDFTITQQIVSEK